LDRRQSAGLNFYPPTVASISGKIWSDRLVIPAINPASETITFAFRKALRYMQFQPKQVIVIDDSRHTDMLGAWLVGCPSIQVAFPTPFAGGRNS